MTDNPAYELFDEIGRGENTVVYRGYDLDLGRDVAIKELNEQGRQDARRAEQFLKEASFLAQFEHENILRIYCVDKDRGWIVMELMKGTLASQIATEPMAPDTVRSVLRQILGALDFLHQKNKVHGAVRPSNILINDHGTVKLSDFEASDPEGELRAPTGSKKHLAPELIRPEFGSFGPTVDMYCLGFTALELLTGQKFESLFPGTGKGAIDADVAWLRWHSSEEELAPVKQLCPGVPDDLANVIDQLLSKNVSDRPASAKEVLGMLSEQAFIPVMVGPSASKVSDVTGTMKPGVVVKELGERTHQKSGPDKGNQKKSSARQRPSVAVGPKSTKDKVNDFLGKPYVLWPLCAFMLIGAVLIGLGLQGDDQPDPATGEAPQPKMADVRFNISPDPDGVQLFLNGEEKQLGDAKTLQLASGTYELKVMKEGYAEHAQSFDVATDDKQLDIVLEEVESRTSQYARVRIDISPDANGVGVEIDGIAKHPNVDGVYLIDPGTYVLQVRKAGFETHTQTLSVKAGENGLAIDLRPTEPDSQVANLWLDIQPGADGTNVLIDGNRVVPNRDGALTLEAGTYELLVQKDGFVDFSQTLTVEPGESSVAITLIPLPAPTQVPDAESVAKIDPDPKLVDPFATLQVSAGDNAEKVENLKGQFTGEAQLVIDSGGFLDELSDVSFSPDGKLVAGAGGKVVRIWNIETGELVTTLRGDRSRTSYGNVFAAKFSPDGKTLLVGINDYKSHGSIREYSTDDFSEIKRLIPGHTAPCRKIAFSKLGERRISADADGNMLIVDAATDQLIGKIEAANADKPLFDVISYPDANSNHILALDFEGPKAFSPTGKMLGPQELPDKFLGWFMDVFTKKIEYPFGSKTDPRVLDFAMERNEWAAAGVSNVNGRNRFWAAVFPARGSKETSTPSKPKQVYTGHRWSITCLQLGPLGELAVSGDKFGEVHVWNRKTGKLVRRFTGQGKSIYEVAFDRNSNRIAFGTEPYKPDVWDRNHYGSATQVLDLRQRAILPFDAAEGISLINETPKLGTTEVGVTRGSGDGGFDVNLKENGNVVSKYRMTSARNPTVYSLIDQAKLGVKKPVVFGDSDGLLALWDTSGDELRRAFIGHGSLVSGVSVDRTGKLMVSASTDRTIRIWSLENHTPTGTFDFKFENTSVTKIRPGSSSHKAGAQVGDEIVSMDGLSVTEIYNRMLKKEFDYVPGQVVPMKMKRGGRTYSYDMTMDDGYDFVDPTLNFYVGDDGQWIVWSPIGYYDASPGADRLIGWHVNRGPAKSAKFFEVQQFRKQLYRPDVINLILDGHDVQEAVRIANEAKNTAVADHDFRSTDEIALHHPPEVRILRPQANSQVTENTVEFVAEVDSPNGLPIREATLLHNGNAVKVFKPNDVSGTTLSIQHAVELVAGNNRLELVASNAKASSEVVGVDLLFKSRAPVASSDVHVLAVGVSSHQNPVPGFADLQSASGDARAFAEAVAAHQNGKIYRNVSVKLLTEAEATRTNIVDGFQWLVDNVKPNDSVMVFFSGNAFVDSQENFYLATHDVDVNRLRATALEWRQFTRMLHEDLPACTRLVFLDAQPTQGGVKAGMRNPLLDLAAPELGTTFFASNTLQPLSIQAAHSKRGMFVQAIIETMGDQQADIEPDPSDQMLNPAELAGSLRTRIQKASAGRQLPTYFATARHRKQNFLELFPTGGGN